MGLAKPDTEDLLAEVERGDAAARGQLFERQRGRVRGMLALRMDPRLIARIDPSDVVQETFTDAHRQLDVFLRDRPLPFYPWLRQLALDRLSNLHRHHIRTGKRAIDRVVAGGLFLSDESL